MNSHIKTKLVQVDALASALHHTCFRNVELLDSQLLIDLLSPLADLLDQLEEMCAGTELAAMTRRNSRYLAAMLKVIAGNQSMVEPCMMADLLLPILTSLDAVEEQIRQVNVMGSGARQELHS
ncbi:TPA: hypothetical protein ACSP2J_000957 [Aeromonas hydrophila]